MNSVKVWLSVILLIIATSVSAQVLKPVKWSFAINRLSDTEAEVVATASIEGEWHLYAANIPEGGPVPTALVFEENEAYKPVGELLQSPEPKFFHDENFDMELAYFTGFAKLTQKIEISKPGKHNIKGYVVFMACDDSRCLPPDEVEFELTFESAGAEGVSEAATGTASPDATVTDEAASGNITVSAATEQGPSAVATASATSSEQAANRGFWGIFWLAFLGGLTALLTPCVFPMIPLTVSFFLRNADNKARAFRDGSVYGITIMLAYLVLGLAIALIFGADALNRMATSPVFNVIFFVLLIVFAASFLGAFELTMPSKWSTKLDSKADQKGGLIGVMLMGLTFVLVSFSCTGPIVGYLLVEAAVAGSIYAPAVGMFGFGLALAIPFALFAMFPAAMNKLPKSGSWMNSVKVVLGFVILALSLKFLSVADSVSHWELLDREVFLALWIAIFFLLGLYLIGAIKFSHDSELKYLGVPRLGLAILTFAFVAYLIPGLWGAPLKAVGSFLPSITTQDFNLNEVRGGQVVAPVAELKGKSIKAGPYGLVKYTDYDEGLTAAKEAGKPIFLDFTGHACVNCKKMETTVWSDSRVRDMLANDFIIISLYVDDRTVLPEDQQFVSETTGKKIRTVGNKWTDFMINRYKVNSQPYYVILDHNEVVLNTPRGFNSDTEAYVEWLREGLGAFRLSNE